MKHFSKILILSAVMALPFGLSASESSNSMKETTEDARCTIKTEDFSASGNCGAVLRAYRKWKELNNEM